MNKFNSGDTVICVNEDLATHGLKLDEHYIIDYQTYMGYVWVEKINCPFLNSRFKLI